MVTGLQLQLLVQYKINTPVQAPRFPHVPGLGILDEQLVALSGLLYFH